MIIRNPKKIKTVTQGIFQTLRICRQPCSAGVRRCVTAAGRYRCFQICHPNLSLHQKFANRQNILISRQKPFHNQNITCRRYSYCSVHSGTDHTREKVPFLAYSPSMQGSGRLETSDTFAAVGATIADNFEVAMPEGTLGTSVLEQLK